MGPSIANIFHNNFIHNISLIREAVGEKKIMAVVKANAYGHGSVQLANSAIKAGCEYLGVAFVEEGFELRKAGIKSPILVFGSHHPEYLIQAVDFGLDITLTSIEQIINLKKKLNSTDKKAFVHIKVDTGMHRIGFLPPDFMDGLKLVINSPEFELKGIYSHFSTSDDIDNSYAKQQIKKFNEIKESAQQLINNNVLFHMANSGAIMKYPDAYFDMVRPGVMLYGGKPNPDFPVEWNLKQVMELRSKICFIHNLSSNQSISYSRRYFTKNDTRIAVIPIGYADGYKRGLTNIGQVIINNHIYAVAGTVCMDMIMVELNNETKCFVGDDVILYGEKNDLKISIDDVAKKTGTIAYEITCNISNRIPRNHIYK